MEKAEETRLKVFEELQDYYRNELRLSNYSERLGNLMTVVHEAGVSNYLIKFILITVLSQKGDDYHFFTF